MFNLNLLPKPKTVITVTIRHSANKELVWKPQAGEKVIYFSEDRQEFRTGIYFGTWAERSNSNEASPFLHECLPYCGAPENQVFRAFVLDLEGFSDYADVEIIGEFNMKNLEWAHSENIDIRAREAAERLMAFGKVEAVA